MLELYNVQKEVMTLNLVGDVCQWCLH